MQGSLVFASPYVGMEKSHGYAACNSAQAQHLLGWIDLSGDRGSVWKVKREQDMQNYVVPRDSGMFRKHSTRLKKRRGQRQRIRRWEVWRGDPSPLLLCWLSKCNWAHGAIGLQQTGPIIRSHVCCLITGRVGSMQIFSFIQLSTGATRFLLFMAIDHRACTDDTISLSLGRYG